MWKETGREKRRFTILVLLADGRCRQAVLDFLFTTDVGRLVPAEEDAVRMEQLTHANPAGNKKDDAHLVAVPSNGAETPPPQN